MNEPKNILIIQTAFLGDLIMTTPLYRAICELYPYAEVHTLIIPSGKTLIQNNPFINKVHTFNKKNGLFNKIKEIFRIIKIFKSIKFELAISVQHSLTSSLIMLLSGIPNRIGNRRMKFVTQNVYIPLGLHNRHRVLSLLLPISTKSFKVNSELFLTSDDVEKPYELLNTNNSNHFIKIGISPGSVWKTKMWIKEHFIELINQLSFHKIHIYLFGSPAENELCNEIMNKSACDNVFNYAGELSLIQTAAMIGQMDLMLTNDSAPLHIANALHTPVFAFFGPTVRRYGCYPYRANDKMLEVELDCRPCTKHGGDECPLGHHNCMKQITPDIVYNHIVNHFKL